MERSFEKNIKRNYTFMFFRYFILTNGIWMVYLNTIKGFSLFQVGMLESVFHITGMLMETPTGVIADLYGRKTSRMLGVISFMIYALIIVLFQSYTMMVIGFIICGLSYNLESGAGTAHIYDSLKVLDKEHLFMKVNSYIEMYFQLGSSLAILVGGFVAQYLGFDVSYYLMVVIGLISLYILFMMKENDMSQVKSMSLWDGVKKQYIDSFKMGMKNKKLLFLMITSAFFGAMITIAFFYLQNYWDSLSVSIGMIGFFLALHGFASAFGGAIAYKIEGILKEKGILLVIPLFTLICLWGLIIQNITIMVVSFIIIGTFDSIFFVVLSDYMNKMIDSSNRATLLSFSSMLFSIIMIVIFPVLGKVGDTLGLHISFILLASIASISFIGYYFVVMKFGLKTKTS